MFDQTDQVEDRGHLTPFVVVDTRVHDSTEEVEKWNIWITLVRCVKYNNKCPNSVEVLKSRTTMKLLKIYTLMEILDT